MGARISQAMEQAIELIKGGKTCYEAAKITGIEESTISRSRLYKEYVNITKKQIVEEKPVYNAMDEVRRWRGLDSKK